MEELEVKKHMPLTGTEKEHGGIMLYVVKRIEEDLDFGCEERTSDAPVMAVITLLDADGEEKMIKMEDALLYSRNINEGDKVYFDTDDTLEKALGENWTENRSQKPVDTTAFTNMMQDAKAGKSVNWKCPFCGGNVILMKNEEEHTVIGCEDCDMRINLESR